MHNRWIHKETDDFLLELERASDGNLFLHINIRNWNHRVYKEIISVWLDLEDMLKGAGENKIYGILPSKNEEFALMFGWSLHGKRNGFTLVSKEIM